MARVRRKRTWLIPLVRQVLASEAERPLRPAIEEPEELDRRLALELSGRGFDVGLPLDQLRRLGDPADAAAYDEYALLNTLAHELLVAARVARRQGVLGPPPRDLLLMLGIVAHAVGDDAAVDRVWRLLDAPAEVLAGRGAAREINALAADLGRTLAAGALDAGDPLLGHPFHQILLYQDALRFGRLAWLVCRGRKEAGGVPDPAAVLHAHGQTQAAVLQTISACIALTAADGVVDEQERRLIAALVRAARLDDTAAAMLEAELRQPRTPEALAAEVHSPPLRRAILRLTCLAALVNGRYTEPERWFVEGLAEAFDVPAAELAAFEAEALANLQQHARLLDQLSLTHAVRRLRDHLTGRIEEAVRENAARLWAEIRETRELCELLVKAGATELTPDEKAQVKAQLSDICRAIPALAIFAVPGGSLLLPIALKHLPFNLLPSNFNDDEAL